MASGNVAGPGLESALKAAASALRCRRLPTPRGHAGGVSAPVSVVLFLRGK